MATHSKPSVLALCRSTHSGLVDVFQLCCPHLHLQDVVSLSQSSKQVKSACLDQPDQQLQQWLQQAITSHPNRCTLPDQRYKGLAMDIQIRISLLRPRCPSTHSICWLFRQCCRSWGLLPLASRLQLQKALLAAQDDPVLSALLISAGARVTEPLLISAAWEGNPGPLVWVRLQQFLGVSLGLPEIISDFCPPGRVVEHKDETLQLLSAGYLLDLAAVMWSTPAVSRSSLNDIDFFAFSTGCWSPYQHEKLLRLLLANAERAGLSPSSYLRCVLQLKGMKNLPVLVRMELFEAAASGYAFDALWTHLGHDLTREQRLQLALSVLRSPCFDRQLERQVGVALRVLPSVEELTDVDTVQQLLHLAVEMGSADLLYYLVEAPAAGQLPTAAAEELIKEAAEVGTIECWCWLRRTCCVGAKVSLDNVLEMLNYCLDSNGPCGLCSDEVGDLCNTCLLLSEASCHQGLGSMALENLLGLLQQSTADLSPSMLISIDRIRRSVCTVVSRPQEVEQVLESTFNLSSSHQQRLMGMLSEVLGGAAGQQLSAVAVEKWMRRAIADEHEALLKVIITSLPAAAEVEVEGLVKCCVGNKQVACLEVLVKHLPGMNRLGVEQVCKLMLLMEGSTMWPSSCVYVLRQLLPDN